MGTSRRVLVLGCASSTPYGRDKLRRAAMQARDRGLVLIGADTAANLRQMDDGLVAETVSLDVFNPEDCRAWAAGGPQIDAVMTFREMCVESAAIIAGELALPGNDPAVTRTIRNKDLCRTTLSTAGFDQPAVALVNGIREAEDFLAVTAPGPWVVKPRSGMGSVGVSLVREPNELARAIDTLSSEPPFLLETFVVGDEFSAEGVMIGQEPIVLGLTAKKKDAGFVESGHRMPAVLSEQVAAAARRDVARALKAVGVTHGIFHVEFWVTPDGIVLGEVHARDGGDFIHLMLEKTRPGLQLYGALFDDLLGERPRALPEQTMAAGVEFVMLPPGRLRSIQGWSDALADEAIVAADLAVGAGRLIGPVLSSADRHGVVVVVGDTSDDVDSALRRVRAAIRIVVDEAT